MSRLSQSKYTTKMYALKQMHHGPRIATRSIGKCLNALEAKQDKVTKNHCMQALMYTPSHSCHGREVGVAKS
jgi:hypothetical protein